MAEELICPVKNCRDMPIIKFIDNSSKIEIKCATHLNNGKIYNLNDYLKLCDKYNKKLLCYNCKNNLNNSFFCCTDCKRVFDEKCIINTKCTNQSFHKKVKITHNQYFDKIVCLKHTKTYNQYCKNCKISFCEKCILKNHEKHHIVKIDEMKKTKNEIKQIETNLNIAENYFTNIKKIKMKKLMLKNYMKNSFNGNSIENLDNINLSIDKRYKEKIDNLLNKKDIEKLFCLNYYQIMIEKVSGQTKNKIISIKKELMNLSKSEVKKEPNNFDNIENIKFFKKNFVEESDNENNVNRSSNKTNSRTEFIKNEMNINNNKNDLQEANYDIEQSKYNYKFEKKQAINSIINTIIEKSKILTMTRLTSGNLALGLSNGIIKVYNCDSICLPNNNKNNIDKNLLLTITQFKGRRINYIYQLKDNSLLCCTFSKIHHIELINKDLIVCLSEKNYRKENLLKNKCILRVYKKENNSNNQDDSGILSDSLSLDSSNSSSMSSDWESLYSNEEDEPLNNKDDLLMEDKYIKIYKKNKNYDKLYLCSIFGTKTVKSKEEDIIYEFIATSNKIFEDGENCVLIYGIMKKMNRHGYTFFIQKKLDEMPCSKMVNSICKISSKNIAIALQKYNEQDNNGIAIIDMEQKLKIGFVGGFSIGMIYREIPSRFIFYATNTTKDVNKCNQIRFVYDLCGSLDKDELKIVCNINTRFSGLLELKPNKNSKLFFYVISSDKALFIISINKPKIEK